jgi:hypothetical protein
MSVNNANKSSIADTKSLITNANLLSKWKATSRCMIFSNLAYNETRNLSRVRGQLSYLMLTPVVILLNCNLKESSLRTN